MNERRLSILFFGTQLAIGGAQKVLLDQARWFHQRGHQVTVIFLYDKENLHAAWQGNSNFPVNVVIPYKPGIRKTSIVLRTLGSLYRLWRILRQGGFDVVEAFTHDSNMFILPLAWITSIPVRLATHHGVIDGFPRWRQDIHTFIVNHIADALIAVSSKIQDQAIQERIRKDRIVVIQNGIEPLSLEGINPPLVRKETGLHPADPFLISVGRLVYQKAHQVLVSAMPIILKEFPSAKLGICGDGILRAELETQIQELGLSESVKLLGKSHHVARFLCIADIFVLPSRWEGLPIALLEAMSVGLPVVATRVEGVDEVVFDGEHGLLVDVGDINALAQAILQLLRDPEIRRKMGSASQARLRELYSIDHMAERYLALMIEKLDHKALT